MRGRVNGSFLEKRQSHSNAQNLILSSEEKKMEENGDEVGVIHSWSAPRSLSTSLMYSFAQMASNQDEPIQQAPSSFSIPAENTSSTIPVERVEYIVVDDRRVPKIDFIGVEEDSEDETKKRKNASKAWEHFKKIKPNKSFPYRRARCKHCSTRLVCDSVKHGSSTISRHLKDCKHAPGKTGPIDNYTISYSGTEKTAVIHKFDCKYIRQCLVEWIICDEQPFNVVESDKFKKFVASMEPRFDIPCRVTVARDVFKMYTVEKAKLKSSLAGAIGRVSLTTDTWTSMNNQCYMCVTAHFIDNNWVLHKRIIAFKMIDDHRGDSIGKVLEAVVKDWGISKILCITLDNAPNNNGAVDWIRKYLGNHVLGGKHLQVRCFAHIVNIMVKYGLSKLEMSVERIRTAVKYATATPQRAKKFSSCVAAVGITYSKGLIPDTVTRWNSLYTSLDIAEKYEKAFDRLADEDSAYRNIFASNKKLLFHPMQADWEIARKLIPFLKPFYDATNVVSGTSYVTSHRYFGQFCILGQHLYKSMNLGLQDNVPSPIDDETGPIDNEVVVDIAWEMKVKYNEYFGTQIKVNPLVYLAVVLDPRCKMSKVKSGIRLAFDSAGRVDDVIKTCDELLRKMYEEYKLAMAPEISATTPTSTIGANMINDPVDLWDFDTNVTEYVSSDKSEVDRYLDDLLEKPSPNFDLLGWWKTERGLPTLAAMARDIFAVPASSVASESAFSTGGRVISNRRCSLKPRTVEALLCTQSWLNNVSSIDSGFIESDVDEETAEIIELAAIEALDGIHPVTVRSEVASSMDVLLSTTG